MKKLIINLTATMVLFITFYSCEKQDIVNPTETNPTETNSNIDTTNLDLLKIYLRSSGDDANTGLTFGDAVQTLNRVQEILYELCPQTDIEVHINQGNYLKQEVVWTFSNGKKITFTAIDFSTDRPVFNGVGRETWFKLDETGGINTNLSFRYIKVMNYKLGVYFRGNRCDPYNGWNGNNHLYGMYFENIGNKFTLNTNRAVAAVDFVKGTSKN